jgi:hypothetical protein
MVQLDNEYKVTQYGQWDGYPTGTGKDIVEILKKIDLNRFKAQLRDFTLLVPEDMAFNSDIENMLGNDFSSNYPELSRNTGAKILELIYNTNTGLILADNLDFGNDSLYCEWAYCINLDKNTLEIYQGFNKDSSKVNYRFDKNAKISMDYSAVKFIGEYPLEMISESLMERLEKTLGE